MISSHNLFAGFDLAKQPLATCQQFITCMTWAANDQRWKEENRYPCSWWEEQGSRRCPGALQRATALGVSSAVTGTVIAVTRVTGRIIRAVLGEGRAGDCGGGHGRDEGGYENLLHVDLLCMHGKFRD